MTTQDTHHTSPLDRFYSDPDAEQALIGTALADPAIPARFYWIESDWFTNVVYRDAWSIMLGFAQRAEIYDHLSVADRMHADQEINWSLIQAVGRGDIASEYTHTYADIVHKHAQRRMCVSIAKQLVQSAAQDAVHLGVESALQTIGRIIASGVPSQHGSISYRQLLNQLDEDIDARQHGDFRGLRTGIALLDKALSSMEPGMLIQIAGRPGCGKSALGLSIARRVAGWLTKQRRGESVEVVTMEMSAIAQVRRLTALRTKGRITSSQMRRGFLNIVDEIDVTAWKIFQDTREQEIEVAGDTLYFVDKAITTRELSLRLATAKAQRNMRLAIIDQLDLFTDTGKHGETERIGEISRELKQISRNLGVVIICLCQLNRNVEGRQIRRPELSDMRQSGRIEQDADVVLGLYRPIVNRPMKEDDPDWYPNYAEAMVLKNRDGEANISIPLWFIPAAASYTDWPDELRYAPDVIAKLEGGRS